MIQIEDKNNESYYINPKNVVYVKARVDPLHKEEWWKIAFVNGEQLHTRNKSGVEAIIRSIKIRK